ncbi:MAG: DNA polymerase Y family protein [bacterium]|nr:DNA polymerase Y family protein [bacterium]
MSILLAVRIPDYPLAVVVGGDASDEPRLLADRYDRGHVIALDTRARAAGARIGQTVTQAAAVVPNARVLVHDAERSRAVWAEMLDALDAVTPLVEEVREGVAFLDMRGIAGDAAQWIAQAEAALARFGLPLRIGAGPNKFCAYAAGWIAHGTVLDERESAARLAPLPLDVLDLDPNAQTRLHLLGVTTLGELARLPHGAFVRRFGRDAARWHAWARGEDRTPFVPRGHALAIEAALFGEGHADDEASVFFALRVLLARICGDLERCGKRASLLRLEVELDNGERRPFDVHLAAPTADEKAMLDVLRAKLEDVRFDAPLVGLRVRAMELDEGGEELVLVRTDDIDRQSVAVLLARLESVIGAPVRRARTRAAHPLEERFRYEPFVLPKHEPPGGAVPLAPASVVPQLRLLAVKEIDVRVRRGEPHQVDGRSVARCAGPWRIDDGWFGAAIARDEYDVVLDDGEVCRIYRQGTHWYLRGSYD